MESHDRSSPERIRHIKTKTKKILRHLLSVKCQIDSDTAELHPEVTTVCLQWAKNCHLTYVNLQRMTLLAGDKLIFSFSFFLFHILFIYFSRLFSFFLLSSVFFFFISLCLATSFFLSRISIISMYFFLFYVFYSFIFSFANSFFQN